MENLETKKCCRCKKEKGSNAFNNCKSEKSGKSKRCKECHNEVNLIYLNKNRKIQLINNSKQRELNLVKWLDELTIIHNGKYDYSKCVKQTKKAKQTITCPTHGDFEQTLIDHYDQGCQKCSGRGLSTNEKLIEIIKVHGDKYDYSNIDIINKGKDVKITYVCPKHGEVTQLYRHHKSGYGCKYCGKTIDYSIKNVDDNVQFFQKLEGELYMIELSDSNELFYKIGITINKTRRYRELGKVYDVKELFSKTLPMDKAIYMEHLLLEELKMFKYLPNKVFKGQTECLLKNPLDTYMGYYYEIIENNKGNYENYFNNITN